MWQAAAARLISAFTSPGARLVTLRWLEPSWNNGRFAPPNYPFARFLVLTCVEVASGDRLVKDSGLDRRAALKDIL